MVADARITDVWRFRCFNPLAILLAATLGCATTAGPNFANPGSAEYQRLQAQRYDPYPERGPGPEIVGGRPRDFDRGLPETSRARWSQPRWLQPR